MSIKRTSAILLAAVVFSCTSPRSDVRYSEDEIKGAISISGAFALYPLVNVWAEEFTKEHPDVRINISAGGAGKGMADVLSGAADLGMFSREITPEEKQKGVWWVSVARDAVLPTISDKNPAIALLKTEGLTAGELSRIFLKEGGGKWKNSGQKINVYTRADAAGAAAVWADYLGGAGQEAIKGIAVYGDPGLADAVRADPNGIGFNNVIYVYDLASGKKYAGIEVIPIDVNENGRIDPEEDFYDNLSDVSSAIDDGRYPSPPARELYLIAKGVPEKPQATAFLKWTLIRGQEFVEENGYIRLDAETIEAQKRKF